MPEEVVLVEASQGHLPGRKIADTWRFLKAAVDDWLSSQDSRSLLLSKAGIWADDDMADEMLKKIYEERGRPETEK